jgi:hypothetical protein
MYTDVLLIVRLEVAIVRLVESNQDGHDLAQAHLASSQALPLSGCNQLRQIRRLKFLAEIVHMAEQLNYTHGWASFARFGLDNSSVVEGGFLNQN